jgi:NifU-like protein involved in Fe-S cluster formation
VYGPIIKDHFARPRNTGELEKPDAVGSARNESDGDRVELYFRIMDGRILEVRMKVMGCVAAIASASLLTETIKGMTAAEALSVTKETLAEKLGGLPEHKIRCSLTCIDALKCALEPLGR